jgi:hypothetical protein
VSFSAFEPPVGNVLLSRLSSRKNFPQRRKGAKADRKDGECCLMLASLSLRHQRLCWKLSFSLRFELTRYSKVLKNDSASQEQPQDL